MSIPTDAKTMTFLVTADRAAAKRFYTGVLGFAVRAEDDFAVVFDLNGTMLRMATVESRSAPDHTVLGWEVSDVDGTVRALRGKGVVFVEYGDLGQDELGIWHVPGGGARVAWFRDPDENLLSVTQFG